MRALPLGKTDFGKLIRGNYIYVDKTRYIYEMVRFDGYFFLSRPRRFGKSLLLSTIEYLFKCEKELFEGTWIYGNWSWERYPVVRIDINNTNTQDPHRFEQSLLEQLETIAASQEIVLERSTYDGRFAELIEKLSVREGKGVVLLIDEYEKPVLDNVANKPLASKMREILRQFYGKIKSLDGFLRFVLITGITRFTKAGVFSALNNLTDVSFHRNFGEMLGYTRDELERYFADYIERICARRGMTREELLNELEDHYGGYCFDGEHVVFNPYAVLLFFNEGKFVPHWEETGMTGFLKDYFESHGVTLNEIVADRYLRRDDLVKQEIEDAKAKSFLMQAGYLTIKRELKDGEYEVGFPNLDAGRSVMELMLELQYGVDEDKLRRQANRIRETVDKGDVEGLVAELRSFFGSLGYSVHERLKRKEPEKLEAYYSSMIYALLFGSGVRSELEKEVAGGKIDVWFRSNGLEYMMEVKVDGSLEDAMDQLRRYSAGCMGRKCFLIGIVISSRKRNIDRWAVELLDRR